MNIFTTHLLMQRGQDECQGTRLIMLANIHYYNYLNI